MTCCAETETPVELRSVQPSRPCESCKGPSRPVTLRTMFLMLRPECFDLMGESQYHFCASPDCPVVYFSRGRSFTIGDLRIRVWLKESDDSIPLCYCFGFTKQGVREEIAANGSTMIPQRIKAFIKERMCACEERNPSGACCLGDVMQVVQRLMKEAV